MRRIAALFLWALAGTAAAEAGSAPAEYRVTLRDVSPTRVAVHATLPSDGQRLEMSSSRPGDVPEVADAGWPALVRHLHVTDADGQAVGATLDGDSGWTLARAVTGRLTVDYEVDYAPLAKRGWPAAREAAFVDADHVILVGRSLFITTPTQGASEVRFSLPDRWHAVLPWTALHGARGGAAVGSTQDLQENLIAFSRAPPALVSAGGFKLEVVALGHWLPVLSEVQRVVGAVVKQLVSTIGFSGDADYLVVLLPQLERGGESFRASFALTLDAAPSRANWSDWGSTIAHEVFHYWNGWRMRGADYPSSQWFQEGFTEYAANLAMVRGGLISPDQFRAKLAVHISNYGKLATPLDAPGTRKGPPLYSGGALVAFVWDTMIREASRDERDLGDFLRALWMRTDAGTRPYTWPEIEAALQATAQGEWSAFERRHIHGTEPLPVAEALRRVGFRLSSSDAAAPRIEPDAEASAPARARGAALIGVGATRDR